jgi:APA family basic amino acid/polyamine antiporter
MAAGTPSLTSRLLARKSIESLQRDARSHGLKRTLGPFNLMFLGVGCIIGAGVYVLTGSAAASFAGPGVMISFIIAGLACALTGLCYAELAAALPVSGSSYTYCYAALGEVFAWVLGCLLMLEYGLAGSTLAVGFSGYFASLLQGLGVTIAPSLVTSTVSVAAHSGAWVMTGGANLVAVAATAVVCAVLVLGVSESALANNILVVVKTLVLATFVAVGVFAINPHNWHPLIPPNEGGFTYGWPGVWRAASILFFAYFGFETVSTAASEARNPQKDMPFGILGALAVSTLVYIVVAAVLTGVVPFRELGVPDPIAVAADRIGHPRMAMLIKLGALMGLSSVLLVNAYGQSRITFAMARDGLLPQVFQLVHPRFRTPHAGIILLCAISASLAALFPLSVLADLVSLGTGLAFSIVCLSLIWLRSRRPDLPRPFRVPLGGVWIGGVWFGTVPVAAIIMCWLMVLPVGVDIVTHALHGRTGSAWILGCYLLGGILMYLLYGLRHSRVGRNLPEGAAASPANLQPEGEIP